MSYEPLKKQFSALDLRDCRTEIKGLSIPNAANGHTIYQRCQKRARASNKPSR